MPELLRFALHPVVLIVPGSCSFCSRQPLSLSLAVMVLGIPTSFVAGQVP